MKAFKAIIILLVFAAVHSGCVSDSKTTNTATNAAAVDKALPAVVTGNFFDAQKPVIAKLIKPKLNSDGTDCIDSGCVAYISFSDTTMKAIPVKHCIGGKLDNLGDLNGDGRDEIGLLPDWFTSCWHDYLVYTFKKGEWTYAVPPIPTHCNQWEAHIKPIEKDSLNKGYVVIRYSEFDNKDIVNRSKIIAIK